MVKIYEIYGNFNVWKYLWHMLLALCATLNACKVYAIVMDLNIN